jgi:hypothetical protein
LIFHKGEKNFETILKIVSNQLKKRFDKKNLTATISRNVKNEASILIRLLPLSLKDALMPLIYLFFGENSYTSSISNVGKISMPESIAILLQLRC